jgi:arylsulfatase A-like enzyme
MAQFQGDRAALQQYFAAVTALDANVGRLLQRLEELGLREDTLVVFMSDNGFSCGHHGFWGKGNGTNPRNMYENSIRVPAVFSHPGALPAGQVCADLVSAYDFTPTLLEYLDLPLPADGNLPGNSFLPLLRGERRGESAPVFVFDEYGPVRMIRSREWKYVYRHAYGPHELFHLAGDPDERSNLADDPDYASIQAGLHEEMEDWFRTYVIPGRDGLRMSGTAEGQTEPV